MTSTRSLLAAAVLSLSIAAGGAQAAELILNGLKLAKPVGIAPEGAGP